MNLFDVIVPLLLLTSGFYLLDRIPQLQQDPLQQMNTKTAQLLQRLVKTKYFRIIRLNINEECSLGMMHKLCRSKSCTVCRCNQKDIPEFWSSTEKVHTHTQQKDLWEDERGPGANGWTWHVEDEANDRGQYFDIDQNIESFTNYNGSQIWKLIYEQNCFKGPNMFSQMCNQQKILYNIISGLHTSISTHLSRFYKHSDSQSAWADLRTSIEDNKFHFNESEYQKRVLDHPDRIKNLMFLYRVLGKAIITASPYLRHNFTIQSDKINEDIMAQSYMRDLLKNLEEYDISEEEKEALKFFKPDNPHVKEYQKYIHNISEILNCVQCQKCRVFGKMQTYGIGTALKILLGYPTPYKRNEIVALFNAFNKISMSVNTYYTHRNQKIPLGYERVNKTYFDLYRVIGGLIAVLYVWWRYREEFILPEYVSQQVNLKKKD